MTGNLYPLRLLYFLYMVFLSFCIFLPCSGASQGPSQGDSVYSKVDIINRTPNFQLEVTIDGQGPTVIGRGQAQTLVLKSKEIIGEHRLVARAYIPSEHFEKCPVGRELTIIFRISDKAMESPIGEVGWYRVFKHRDFFPNLGSLPPEMYRKTEPRGFGSAIYERQSFAGYRDTREKTGIGALIQLASHKYQIPVALLTAIIEVESSFDAQAVSRKGAMGLMQLMPATCARFSVHRPFDPQENVEGGAKYLNYLLHEWSLSFPSRRRVALSLAAYHAGERRVERYGGVPPFKETRDYIRKVLKRYRSLEKT